LNQNYPKLREAGPQRILQLKKQIEKIRQILDKKETELETSIRNMEERKSSVIESEKNWCNTKLELIDNALSSAQQILSISTQPLDLFASLYEHQDEFVECYSIVDKQSNLNLYTLPPPPFEPFSDCLSQVFYKEKRKSI